MADQGVSTGAGLRENLQTSSPPRMSSARGKERRQPSITPRKFRRFFTPRSRVSSQPSAARRALRDLTAQALNGSPLGSSPLKESSDVNGSTAASQNLPDAKRRKMHHTPDPSSPLKAPSEIDTTPQRPAKFLNPLMSPLESLHPSQTDDELNLSDSDMSELDPPSHSRPSSPIVPLFKRGLAGQLVQRRLGTMPCPGRKFLSFPVSDRRMVTADFCSTPDDVHYCMSHGGSRRSIPFCAAGCHTNSLVAVGDEEGIVRLLDSAGTGSRDRTNVGGTKSKSFDETHLHFQTHGNAIIDLEFSEDDYRLATASGDQTGRVIDMMTQTPIALLDQHTASLKQIRFQPGKGGGNVLATSSRDGSIKVWDLRCRGNIVQDFTVRRAVRLQYEPARVITQGCVVNNMVNAHAGIYRLARMQSSTPSADVTATRGEIPGRIGEVSVTALQFMPAGKEHLLLSACEADTSVKLWDIRNVHASRQKTSTPVSFTAQPESHVQWRPFGISAMSVSTDGARLYVVSKDNTVYAYATSHLITGHAPELAAKGEAPKRRNTTAQQGLGPIYGFRHDAFHATTFYIKSAIRPARDGRPEILAVGSSDGCAILFPTDERYLEASAAAVDSRTALADPFSPSLPFPRVTPPVTAVVAPRGSQGRPALSRTSSSTNLNTGLVDAIPIYRTGTQLVRGHNREVGALSWTSEGKLVTVGDDYLVRCWAEDRSRAASLRTGGEGQGRRWASGWADVGADWDVEEG